MSDGMVVDRRDGFEPVPLVENRRLERKRHQDDLRAAAAPRFVLCRLEQFRAEAALPFRFLHPELPQLARPAPRVPADPRDDAIAGADEEGERLSVADTGGVRVELVDPIFQILHLVWR